MGYMEWVELMEMAGWTPTAIELEPGVFVPGWRHSCGFVYREDNEKHLAILRAHEKAGTTPPPF